MKSVFTALLRLLGKIEYFHELINSELTFCFKRGVCEISAPTVRRGCIRHFYTQYFVEGTCYGRKESV